MMKVNLAAWIAVALGLAMVWSEKQVAAQAPGQIPMDYAYYDYAEEPTEPAEGGSEARLLPAPCACGSSACEGCVSGGMINFGRPRSGNLFAGADWLYLRANVSEATAFVEQNTGNPAGVVETFHPADFDYNSSYRFFAGYRFSDCCGEMLFSYARYRSEATAVSPQADGVRQFFGPCEVNALTDGQVTTNFDVDAQVFDADFGRILPLGSALGDCCDNWCPAWDIKWFFGARYADVEWTRAASTTQTNAQVTACRTRMTFDGGGPRVGIDGRRYIGCNGNFSVFARGGISLLVGDVDYVTNVQTITVGANPTYVASFTRVIPVTEIEVGGSVHLTSNFTITGGYLVSAWHDLGMGDDQFRGNVTGPIYDDANILGFDGAFVRAELGY